MSFKEILLAIAAALPLVKKLVPAVVKVVPKPGPDVEKL